MSAERRSGARVHRALGGLLGAAALLVVVAPARAQTALCDPAVVEWVARCAERSDASVSAGHCDGRTVVLSVGRPAANVELRERGEGSFRVVEGVGIAPVGRFEDWSRAPPEMHVAFEAALRCVEAEAPFVGWPAGELSHAEIRAEDPPERRLPWALFGAFGLCVALLARNRRRLRAACFGRPAGLLGGLFAATFLARLALPLAFFHQNGQGPFWVELALCRSSSHYGPGYAKVFGHLARLGGADPETPLVLGVGLLMALAPPAVFLLARHVGAGGLLALGAALATALDPLGARLARSESYYAVICPLLALAACAALLGARSRRRGDLALGAGAAGLLVATSAEMHPLSWLPSALVTLPIVMAPGLGRRALGRFALVTFLVGAIAGAVAAPAMLEVLRGPLGEQWLRPAGESTRQLPWLGPLLVGALIVLSSKSRRRGVGRALGVGALLVAYSITRATYDGTVAIGGAHDRLYLGVAAAAALGLVAALRRPAWLDVRVIAATLGVVLAAWMAWRAPDWVTLPTDALEQQLVRDWRGEWTRDDRLVYLSRAGERRVQLFPLYACVPEHARAYALIADDLGEIEDHAGALYVRSSLCSTDDGGPACAAVERALASEPLRERSLPARASIPELGYEDDAVEVSLSRLRAAR